MDFTTQSGVNTCRLVYANATRTSFRSEPGWINDFFLFREAGGRRGLIAAGRRTQMTTPNSHGSSETSPVSKQRSHAPLHRRRDVHVLLLTALLISLLAFLALASSEADEGDVIVASASSAQNSHSATLLTDGRVLVAGGWSGTTAIANADLFDPNARTWVAAAPLLTPRIFHAATRLSDGRVLVTGGWDNNGDILTSAEIYDPANAAWFPASPLQNARGRPCSAPLARRKGLGGGRLFWLTGFGSSLFSWSAVGRSVHR